MVEDVRKPSEIELETSNAGPAIFSDRLVIRVGGPGVRIAFCEESDPGKPPMFRSAVLLSIPTALQLRDLLVSMLKEPEEALEAMKKTIETGGGIPIV